MGHSVYLDHGRPSMMTDAPVPQPTEPHIPHYPSPAMAPVFISHAQPAVFQPPLFMQLPMAPIPVLDHTGIFLAGFRDCAAEAIKYLTENEQMSEADPAIQGLRQHLSSRQHTLQSSSAPSSPEKSDSSSSSSSRSPSNESQSTPKKAQNDSLLDEGYSSILQEITKNSTPIHPSSAQSGYFSSPNANMSHLPVFSLSSLPASPIVSSVTPCVTGPVMSSSVISEGSQLDNSLSVSSSEDSTKPLPDLGVLAQSNPAIASVAQELMELLEEEFDDFTDCEDDFQDDDIADAMDESEEGERSS